MNSLTRAVLVLVSSICCQPLQAQNNEIEHCFLPPPTSYNYKEIDHYKIFYREAGKKGNPVVVLLHGYPSSSHTYRNLIPMLATNYHVIAPDNLGSGFSDHPNPDSINYSFDLLASYTTKFLHSLNIENYVLYMQDFGGPVGFRMMMNDPDKIKALIIQNANAYLEGLTKERQEFFKTAQTDKSPEKYEALYRLTGRDAIINNQYLFDLEPAQFNKQSPDAWVHDLAFLSSENDRKIQVRLFQDYYTNLVRYPQWQAMLRSNQPKTLIVWGRKDLKFNSNGAKAYLKDLPNAELHLLDAGHFATEEKTVEIAELILEFLVKNKLDK